MDYSFEDLFNGDYPTPDRENVTDGMAGTDGTAGLAPTTATTTAMDLGSGDHPTAEIGAPAPAPSFLWSPTATGTAPVTTPASSLFPAPPTMLMTDGNDDFEELLVGPTTDQTPLLIPTPPIRTATASATMTATNNAVALIDATPSLGGGDHSTGGPALVTSELPTMATVTATATTTQLELPPASRKRTATDLDNNGSISSTETVNSPPKPFNMFYFTEGKLKCLACKTFVKEDALLNETTAANIFEHVRANHTGFSFDQATATELADEMKIWKTQTFDMRDAFICLHCGKANIDASNLDRSCRKISSRKKQCPSRKQRKMKLYVDENRKLSALPRVPSHKSRRSKTFDFARTIEMIEKYRCGGEETTPYVTHLQPLVDLCHCLGLDFDTKFREFIVHARKEIDQTMEPELELIHKWLEEWMRKNHTELLIKMIDPKTRASLMTFPGLDVNDTTYGATFVLYENIVDLLRELKHFVCFMWRTGSFIIRSHFSEFIRTESQAQDPQLFVLEMLAAYLEEDRAFPPQTDVELYCIVRSMVLTKKKLRFRDCGEVASMVSRVLHMLRAARISSFAVQQDTMRDKTMRFIAERVKTAETDGTNIYYGNNTYHRDFFSGLLPAALEKCKEAFASIFRGESWASFLNCFEPVVVHHVDEATLSFTMQNGEQTISSEDLQMNGDNAETRTEMLQQVAAYLDLAFDCFGFGVGRLTEVRHLKLSEVHFALGTAEYGLVVNKTVKLVSKQAAVKRKVMHVLPTEMCRVFILYRAALQQLNPFGNNLLLALPNNENSHYSMRQAARTLFDLVNTPRKTEIRQVFSTWHNVLFGEVDHTILTATESVANQHGHSERTHVERYHTKLQGAGIKLIRIFQMSLGGVPLCYKRRRIDSDDIYGGLRQRYGPGFQFLDITQRQMVEMVLSGKYHGHVGTPCGSGKSLAWLGPLLAAWFSNKPLNTIIALSPYKLLNKHHIASAEARLANTSVRIGKCRLDVSVAQIAAQIKGDHKLGKLDVVFLLLSEFVELFKNHKSCLKADFLHAIVMDEVHTCLSEVSFRNEYKELQEIGTLDIPVITLSGTLDFALIDPVFAFFNLNKVPPRKILRDEVMGEVDQGFTVDY
ncbi:hypothetical protein FisN_27Hu128 [Fistulifera solaris]|uniref:Helicase ATP-binding domain-containing protein n=1 Tax=Fistulifera solaris TaxID=1519565 RepID=A0A1Z5KPH7_FISSO|nr:hypothetical protein FisN_27Hu128 [Fistulifera solaris]|eukprot:GAX28224.1 hypothetical protein FisN_27Hu128 [Fistulifera solaris]